MHTRFKKKLIGLKKLNIFLTFFLQISVLPALCCWFFAARPGIIVQIALGISATILAIAMWRRWGAPGTRHPLKGYQFLLLRIIFLGTGSVALFAASLTGLAMFFTVLVIINLSLIYLLKMDTDPSLNWEF